MTKVTPAKDLIQSSIEIREFRGKNRTQKRYLLFKGHVRKTDFFKVFAASQLKEACIDILGLEDTPATRRKNNANDLPRKVWKEGGA